MDCHDVRLLQALARRSGDAIDPTERAALQQHLDACPECAALCHSEQVIDAALGSAMRAVAVPAALKSRVLTRLAVSRPRTWPKVAAVAAALLLVLIGGTTTAWALRRPPPVDNAVAEKTINGLSTDPEEVEKWFRDKGVDMATWGQLDSQHLWSYDVIEFQGRRVPKLIFYNRGRAALAEVIVLQDSRFDTQDLTNGFPGQTPNRIFVERAPTEGFVYLIGTTEQSLNDFLREGAR